MNEKSVEARLRDGVKALGGVAYKWSSPGNAGVPDRIVVLPGGVVHFVELKREDGKPTKMQQRQLARLWALGANGCMVYGLRGVETYLRVAKEVVESGVSTARLPEVLY